MKPRFPEYSWNTLMAIVFVLQQEGIVFERRMTCWRAIGPQIYQHGFDPREEGAEIVALGECVAEIWREAK